jgi:23S rRNA (uracil1939-C5)-methyltransferase
LRRVGKIDYDAEIDVISGEPWQYRNRIQLHIENGVIGYFESGSHRLCRIDHCPISSPKLNEVIGLLSREIPRLPGITVELELFTNETEVQFLPSDRIPGAARVLFDRIGTTLPVTYDGFRVSRGSFFQVNRFLIHRLVEAATGNAQGESAIDLYAGVGLFSRALSNVFARVTAVETGTGVFRDLQVNLPGVEAVNTAAEQYLTMLDKAPDLILADPPRAGLGKQAVAELARIRAPQLRIVSCDPATLARDLRGLLAAGYHIAKVTLVDLFPQTFHLESVMHLEL